MSLESLIVLLLSLVLFAALAQSVRKGCSAQANMRGADRTLKIRAIAGSATARYRLGVLHMERSDDAAGLKWLMKSAEAGNAAAQDAIGMMYELGRGVSKDYDEAAKWYQKAAGRGFVNSAVNLGNLYALGRGVSKDYDEAAKWLEHAAAHGGRQANNSLSWLLATCPDKEIRNGQRAIGILSPVVNRGERHPVLLDTLAAAYAETGMFNEALELISEALSKTDWTKQPVLYGQLRRRRDFYEAGKPWREPPEVSTDAQRDEAGASHPPDAKERPDVTGEREDSSPPDEHATPVTALSEDNPRPVTDEQAGAPAETPVEKLETKKAGEGGITASDRGEPGDGGAEPPSHVDYIVEKLLVIEQLLRPLQADEGEPQGRAAPPGSALPAENNPENEPVAPASEHGAGATHKKAAEFAHAFVDALLAERYGEVYRSMEKSFRAAVPEDQVGPMLEQMYDAYGGKPLEAELTAEESGYRTYTGTRAHKFWYALRSARFEKDAFSLVVEILPDEDHFVCSTFFVAPAKKSPGT
jgi:TPR repeat protein